LRNIEPVIAVRGHLVFAGSDNRYTILAHQPTNTAMANIKAQFFQFFGHSGPTVAAQRQAMLFSDMRQQNHILALALANRTGPEGAKAA
jgi:hypothetical protein